MEKHPYWCGRHKGMNTEQYDCRVDSDNGAQVQELEKRLTQASRDSVSVLFPP